MGFYLGKSERELTPSVNLPSWHQRFLQQAEWSRSARDFFLSQNKLPPHPHILEVGCGTGAVLSEFNHIGSSYGVDLDHSSLNYAKLSNGNPTLINANGFALPLKDDFFNVSYCHYLLLWIATPHEIIREMLRVTKPGGWVCVFAEPDYNARLDSPPPLEQLGTFQNQSLESQGVQLSTGRQLGDWLNQVGLDSIQVGILGGHWISDFNEKNWLLEWQTIYHDLDGQLDPKTLLKFQNIDREASQSGSRILFIPTFYAWGKKKI